MNDIELKELEQERQVIRKKRIVGYILVALIFFSFIISFFLFRINNDLSIKLSFISFPLIFIFFIVTIIYFILNYKKIKEFEIRYKSLIIKPVFDKFITDCEFHPEMGIDKGYIRELKAIQMGNIYHSEDFVSGTYKDVNFCRADIVIKNEIRDSDGDTNTTTYFKGQWMIFEFNKSFKHNVQILDKKFSYAIKNNIFSNSEDKRTKMNFENKMFNDKFKVYANSQEEAFYIITPPIMEAIINLSNNISGKLMLFFDDNKLNVAINSKKDSLEPSYKKDASGAIDTTIKEAQYELGNIVNFIEQLKLNNDLYK